MPLNLEVRARDSVGVGILTVALLYKRVAARKHHVHNNSEGPHINALPIQLSLCLLRGHVERGAHPFVYLVLPRIDPVLNLGGEPEVGYFRFIPHLLLAWFTDNVEQNIIRL